MSIPLTWKAYADQIWLQARRDCRPVTATFELTPLCNFRCRMCYVRLDPGRLEALGRLRTADEWLDLARQAMELGLYGVTLSGGEPLLHPEFERLYTELSRMGLMVSVLSNGSLITRKHVELFRAYPPASIRITLYGASNETYRRLCGIADGFDRVMAASRMIIDAGLPLSFSFTETSENVGDLDAVLDIARDFDRHIIVASDLNCAVRGASSEADDLRVELDERLQSESGSRFTPAKTDKVIQQAAKEGLLTGLFRSCRAYRTFFFVDWNGDMENCASMSFCHSKPFEDGFAAAWNDMQENLQRLLLPDRCKTCPDERFCIACPGKRNAESSRPDGIPARYCKEARAWHNLWAAKTDKEVSKI